MRPVLTLLPLALLAAACSVQVGPPTATSTAPPIPDYDVLVAGCEITDPQHTGAIAQAVVTITNHTTEPRAYLVVIGVLNASGDRIGQINAVSEPLQPNQTVTLPASHTTGIVNPGTPVGPATCHTETVARPPSVSPDSLAADVFGYQSGGTGHSITNPAPDACNRTPGGSNAVNSTSQAIALFDNPDCKGNPIDTVNPDESYAGRFEAIRITAPGPH